MTGASGDLRRSPVFFVAQDESSRESTLCHGNQKVLGSCSLASSGNWSIALRTSEKAILARQKTGFSQKLSSFTWLIVSTKSLKCKVGMMRLGKNVWASRAKKFECCPQASES
jgi:hypothetical protein